MYKFNRIWIRSFHTWVSENVVEIVHLMVLSLHCFTLGFDLLKYIDVVFSITGILLLVKNKKRRKDVLK